MLFDDLFFLELLLTNFDSLKILILYLVFLLIHHWKSKLFNDELIRKQRIDQSQYQSILKQKEQTETEKESEGESEDTPVVQTAFIQTSVPQIPKKVSFFNYILALLIIVILMSLFVLSTTSKKNRKYILNKIKKNDDYLLENN